MNLEPFNEFWAHGFLGNSWERWAASFSFALGALVLAYALKGFLRSRLQKRASLTAAQWDDMLLTAVRRTGFAFFLVLALHFGTMGLVLPEKVELAKKYVFFFFLFYQLGVWFTSALRQAGDNYSRQALEKEPARATTVATLVVLGNVLIWVLMVLLLLSNYGVNVSALVAGLGIGGIAVALALQNVLGDLFASLSIVLDRPFSIGDSINVNGHSGTVERIGLKSTLVRSITGEQLVFGNADLLKNVVKNYKRMQRRRVLFSFGVTYETPPAKLNRARDLAKSAVEKQKNATFDRCHLATFAASSLDYELVWWMESSDYNAYVNAHHAISVEILDSFAREGIDFAYPVQVQIEKPNAEKPA